ncbi:MAG TPA: hypothetical protein VEH29_12810, partial [Acidimicrobiales bacterium]|nr:hypothetical protein [Acidimicrobiales bacterium]
MTLPAGIEAAIRSSAAPEIVRVGFERLIESDGSSAERLAAEPRLAAVVAAVMAGSRSLGRLVLTDPAALEVIAARVSSAASSRSPTIADPRLAEDPADLVRRKRLGLLAIAAEDLAGLTSLEEVGEALSDLADGVLLSACALAGAGAGFSVIAMGKHGARELNYASDVD